ncbi:hypothetical protein GYMLUDRAFT_45554 [Collybiopsis luxurians FD-317 M1]|uniref:Cyclin-like domain-containing protein n=1 Tax=Collybiopsis luxurians FD-317 M1 TaxID=944289 RepID=A0A0D0BRW9_9AGAR|nr:hypothetical protein GYMLUDRAFT_45554 [Collybiopsis luxurians FD-317 M1]
MPKKAANPNRIFQPIPLSSVPPQSDTKPDPFYGHEYMACLCARFITHLFASPEYPPTSSCSKANPKLAHFIAYAFHRARLHESVAFTALVLLQRLKARFPSARGSSGHRLFISAYMIASKVLCDDTYSNKSWCVVAQGMFTLREINQMEREMCSYLEWELNVDIPILSNFQYMVKKDFGSPQGSYPTYVPWLVSRRAPRTAVSEPGTSCKARPEEGSKIPSPTSVDERLTKKGNTTGIERSEGSSILSRCRGYENHQAAAEEAQMYTDCVHQPQPVSGTKQQVNLNVQMDPTNVDFKPPTDPLEKRMEVEETRDSPGIKSKEKPTGKVIPTPPLRRRRSKSVGGEINQKVSELDSDDQSPTSSFFHSSEKFTINDGKFNAVGRDMHASTTTHNGDSTTTITIKNCVLSWNISEPKDNHNLPPEPISSTSTHSPLPPSSNHPASDPEHARWSTTTFIPAVYHYYVQPVIMYPVYWIGSYFIPTVTSWFHPPPAPAPCTSSYWLTSYYSN